MSSRLWLVISLCAFSWVSSANAALLGTCAFTAGCGPDFAVLNASANYTFSGSTGTLTINGAVANASFLDGQLDPWPDASDMLIAVNPDVSIPVGLATTPANDNFNLNLTVDGSGNLISGSLSMNGKVASFFGPGNNTNTGFQGNHTYTATLNGIPLDGTLIAGGSQITQLGFDGAVFDFRGNLAAGSLFDDAGFRGIATLSNISGGLTAIDWSQDWTATANLDVVVPLPAAAWFLISGLAGIVATARPRFRH